MKRGTKGLVACAAAVAWYYRQLGYPGDDGTLSKNISESTCGALAYSLGYNGASGLVQTVKTSGGSACSVSIQFGYWKGTYVEWHLVKTDTVNAYYTMYNPWYVSRHGVDS
jgi:hypothetical protein